MKNIFFVLLFVISNVMSSIAQTDNKDNIINILNRADAAYHNKNYESSVQGYIAAGKSLGDISVDDNLRLYVRSQIGLSKCYMEMQSYADGIRIAESLLKLNLTKGEKDLATDLYYNNTMKHASDIEKDDSIKIKEVCSLYEKVLPYVEGEQLKQLKHKLQDTYVFLGDFYIKNLQFTKAIESYFKANDINVMEEEKCVILYKIASTYENSCDIEKAIEYYDKARNAAFLSKNEEIQYKSIFYERGILQNLNDVEKYIALGYSADSLMMYSKDEKHLAEYYEQVADEFIQTGDYDLAEMYLSNFKLLLDKSEDPNFKRNMMSIYNSSMRDLKRKQNDYDAALKYSHELLKSDISTNREHGYLRYLPYLVETQLYAEIKDSLNFERVSDSLRVAYNLTTDIFYKSLAYNLIGAGYSKLGNGEKALLYYEHADSLLATSYSESNDMRITLRELHAGELKKLGRLEESSAEHKSYLELIGKLYGKKSMRYSNALYYYANSLPVDRKKEEFIDLYTQSIDIVKEILQKKLRLFTSRDREGYITNISKRLWNMVYYSLLFNDNNSEFTKKCYNTSTLLKSLLFESDRSMYNTLQTKGTKKDVEDYLKMSSLRMKHNMLIKDFKKNKSQIDSVRIQLRKLDNELTKKSYEYSNYDNFLNFKYENVCSYLKDDDVLFDIVDFDKSGKHIYVAFVVKKEWDNPLVVFLFNESDIDSILKGSDMDMLYSEKNNFQIKDLIWGKLEKYTKKGANVYYVPSGLFYQMSLESLICDDGSLLGQHYNFIRLSSSQRIVDVQNKIQGNKKAVLYGGLEYDIDIAEMQEESKKFKHSNFITMRGIAHGANKFNYLPETLNETEKIGSILRKNGYGVTIFTENEGTEESFLNMHNNSPEILHIATHGFYYTPEEAGNTILLKGYSDAMLLSGLVLSGGNAAWLGKELPQGVMGGVVSAGNISCIDLSNVNLLVLSACKSGMGKVTREGLVGLQRAFKKAGVNTMVMTLWDVSDVVTKEFMVEFYKSLFANNKFRGDKKKAFEKAKEKIRKKYPEPIYWAAFVMVD